MRTTGVRRVPAALVALAALAAPAVAAPGDGMAPVTDDDDGDEDDGDGTTDGERTATPAPAPVPSETGAQKVGSVRDGHKGQLGLSAQIVSGSRFIKTWDSADFCGDRGESSTGNATYCFSRVPVSLDLTVAYGITPHIELMLEMRLGLERDFGATSNSGNGPRLRHYAPGARIYFQERGVLKFFSTAQIALDATGYTDASGGDRGMDVALRNANGLFVDFHDAYGAYAFFGEELAFKRWLEAGLEVGVGIQGRYP
jgi:hypothetical protein